MTTRRINLDPESIRRKRLKKEEDEDQEPQSLPTIAGTIDRVVDYAFNPSREKIREMTAVSPSQAKLLPQLDIIDAMWDYVIEVSLYRQDASFYQEFFKKEKKLRPIPPRIIDDFVYRTAQWQKSVQGMNLKSAIDLALAETETRGGEGSDLLGDFGEE